MAFGSREREREREGIFGYKYCSLVVFLLVGITISGFTKTSETLALNLTGGPVDPGPIEFTITPNNIIGKSNRSENITAHGVCKKVGGPSDKDYFVPTRTSAEWQAFRDHLPSGVSLGGCISPISSGDSTCAIHNGAAKCWGNGRYGKLGNGNNNRSTPVTIRGLTSGVTAISAGSGIYGLGHNCSIHNGAAKCWGAGHWGKLGNGSTSNRSTPVTVRGLTSGVTAISAEIYHTCAIHNGAAKCWGYGGHGQLGNGSTSNRSTPVTVRGLTSGVTAISSGWTHTCAIHNGAAKCWGYGGHGQLGNGSTSNRRTPVTVRGLTSGVTDISAGIDRTCAIHNGAAKCWGKGSYGKLGNGSTSNRSTPVTVRGLTSGVTDISAGCAIHNGAAKCWGYGGNGQLGNGSTSNSYTPVTVRGLTSGVTTIATGSSGWHNCAIHNGAAKCWGHGGDGRLGNGSTSNRSTPVTVSGLSSEF